MADRPATQRQFNAAFAHASRQIAAAREAGNLQAESEWRREFSRLQTLYTTFVAGEAISEAQLRPLDITKAIGLTAVRNTVNTVKLMAWLAVGYVVVNMLNRMES